ncbi:hypothetical protein [Pseudomonas poae]|uniref:hypothetical protein n=1 Tax=Pseudomonas poae TaxID=200451 RepID=UPI00156B82E9|nr:hypothetical protein [Pseudomonas poae]
MKLPCPPAKRLNQSITHNNERQRLILFGSFSALSEIGQQLRHRKKTPNWRLVEDVRRIGQCIESMDAKDKTAAKSTAAVTVAPPTTRNLHGSTCLVSHGQCLARQAGSVHGTAEPGKYPHPFDSELTEMFADEHYEPLTSFLSTAPQGRKPDDIVNGLRASYENYPYWAALAERNM